MSMKSLSWNGISRITARKKMLIMGYIWNSLHGALIGRSWMRGTGVIRADVMRHALQTVNGFPKAV
jgi:hypothetical protein